MLLELQLLQVFLKWHRVGSECTTLSERVSHSAVILFSI